MKLYFALGACSLSPHIVANEVGIKLELVPVNLKTKKTKDGRDYSKINPKGYVPAIELDDGKIVTEGPAIVQYLADLHPEKGLIPKCGTFERIKIQEWLNFIATELHKNVGPFFNPEATDKEKEAATEKIKKRLAYVENELGKHDYIFGNDFSVADAYLYTVLSWFPHFKFDLNEFHNIQKYAAKVAKRKSVEEAHAAEKASVAS